MTSITNDIKNNLIDAAYSIISEEKLPKPTKIRLLSPFGGMKKRRGSCIKRTFNSSSETIDKYEILIYTTKAQYINDPFGEFINEETKQRFKKSLCGIDLKYDEIKEIMAHEIAHLKFWKHDAKHKSYTKHILEQINHLCPGGC